MLKRTQQSCSSFDQRLVRGFLVAYAIFKSMNSLLIILHLNDYLKLNQAAAHNFQGTRGIMPQNTGMFFKLQI